MSSSAGPIHGHGAREARESLLDHLRYEHWMSSEDILRGLRRQDEGSLLTSALAAVHAEHHQVSHASGAWGAGVAPGG